MEQYTYRIAYKTIELDTRLIEGFSSQEQAHEWWRKNHNDGTVRRSPVIERVNLSGTGPCEEYEIVEYLGG